MLPRLLQGTVSVEIVVHIKSWRHTGNRRGTLIGRLADSVKAEHVVISPDFPLELTGFFPGKHLIHFLVLKMKDFRNFVLDNCILDFDAEQVYLKPQVINLKNNEVTVNPKPQTLEKSWFFENPIP